MFQKNKLLYFLAIVLFLTVFQGFAQKKYTIASLGYMGSFNASYTDPAISADAGYSSLNISIPVVINEKTAIITGVRANKWTLSYQPEQIWPTRFYSLGLTLGINHQFSDKNTLLFVAIPKTNSDFKIVQSSTFQLGFLTTYSIKKNENFLWKIGMYYNGESYGPFVVPIFGLDWKLNDKVSISGDLPIHGKLNYKVNKNIDTGFGYIALVSSYRLTENFNDAYTSRFAIEPHLFAETKLFKNTYFNAKVGYAISRNYPIYEKDDKIDWQLSFIKFGDDREQLNPVIENGAFVEIGLSYKIDL